MEETTTQQEGKATVVTKEIIKDVIDGLMDSINSENAELYKSLIDKASYMDLSTADGFYFSLIHTYDKFLSGLIRSKISTNSDVGFILKQSHFIEHQFEWLIKDAEGSPCCADKTRTIVEGLLRFYKNGERIEFDYNQKYTYQLPTKIFKTHESIIEFYEGVRGLYFGNPRKYLEALVKVKAASGLQAEKQKEGDQCQNQR